MVALKITVRQLNWRATRILIKDRTILLVTRTNIGVLPLVPKNIIDPIIPGDEIDIHFLCERQKRKVAPLM